MADVYNFPLKTNEILEKQPFSLYQLMTGVPGHGNERARNGDCYVTGINIIPNGTSGFDALIDKQRKELEWLECSSEHIDEFLEELKNKDYVIDTSDFVAVGHPLSEGLDGCPYKAFIRNGGQLSIIHPDEKRIAVVPYDEEGRHRHLFYDIRGAKMAGVRWQYDGTMADGLAEFGQHGYSFDVGRNPSSAKEILKLGKKYKKDHSRYYIVTDEDIPIEKVIDIVSS